MYPHTKKIILKVAALIVLWCAAGEILIYIFMGVDSKAMLGFLLGSIMAIAIFIHMGISLENSLDMKDEEAAKKNNNRTFAIRAAVVALVLILAVISGYFNVLFIVFGMLGLKVGAYLQPIGDKIISRFNSYRKG